MTTKQINETTRFLQTLLREDAHGQMDAYIYKEIITHFNQHPEHFQILVSEERSLEGVHHPIITNLWHYLTHSTQHKLASAFLRKLKYLSLRDFDNVIPTSGLDNHPVLQQAWIHHVTHAMDNSPPQERLHLLFKRVILGTWLFSKNPTHGETLTGLFLQAIDTLGEEQRDAHHRRTLNQLIQFSEENSRPGAFHGRELISLAITYNTALIEQPFTQKHFQLRGEVLEIQHPNFLHFLLYVREKCAIDKAHLSVLVDLFMQAGADWKAVLAPNDLDPDILEPILTHPLVRRDKLINLTPTEQPTTNDQQPRTQMRL